jgi:DNA-binding CsgD family transcriptional regulator
MGDDTAGCRAIEKAVEVYAFNDLQRMASTSGVLTLARVALANFRRQSQLEELIAAHNGVREQLAPLLPWYRSLSGAVLAFVSVRRGDMLAYHRYFSWCSGETDDALCRTWAARAQQAYAAASPLQTLSPAELRVWELLRGRQTLSEIASTLFLSRETVKSHTVSIYRKVGVASRREAQELAETWR